MEIATPVCGLVRNDREVGFAMTGKSMVRNDGELDSMLRSGTLTFNCQLSTVNFPLSTFLSAFVLNSENKLKIPVKSPLFFDKYYSLQQVPPIV